MRRVLISILTLSTALLTTQLSVAQSFGGVVTNHDIMMATDFAQLSVNQPFGTARSMAMGSAFTSLGADHASNSINPAGLGMYMSEEFTFTPMISSTNSSTPGAQTWMGDNVTKFGFSNIGANFNLAESARGSLISLTASFTYNKLANYNSQVSFSSLEEYQAGTTGYLPSVVDLFGQQLYTGGIYPASSGSMSYDSNPYYWPAQLAYKTYMLDPTTDSSGNYNGWTTNTIGHNASIRSSMDISQKGSSDEYVFGIGGNISNILYFGVSFGLQDINQSTQYTYQEDYYYDTDDGYAFASLSDEYPLDYQLEYSYLIQETRLSGTGSNIKLGLIARPTRGLRVGVAFHSPTFYSLSRSYIAKMETSILGNYDDLMPQEYFTYTTDTFIDDYENSWQYITPSKLLTGISYQFGSLGIASFDYERQWYNGIRVSGIPYGAEYSSYDYKMSFKDYYQAVNTFRMGLEVKPLPMVALRAGGGFSSSMLKDESLFYSSPVATSSSYYSCGVGIQFSSNTAFDFTYQCFNQNYTPYKLFYAEDGAGGVVESKTFSNDIVNNYFVATFSFKI